MCPHALAKIMSTYYTTNVWTSLKYRIVCREQTSGNI